LNEDVVSVRKFAKPVYYTRSGNTRTFLSLFS
jgi:hypothetical protein